MRERDREIQDDDLEYIGLCLEGDVEAFGTIVDKYQKKMLNVAFRMLGNYEEACDIVQDALVSAFSGLKGFKGQSKFSTWLFTIVINQSRNRLKQMRSRKMREDYSLDDPIVTDDGAVILERSSGNPSALELLEKKNVQEKVQRCIDKLDTGFREVIVLRDMQEFTYDEISEMLKIPEGTVKSRLFRAREAMRNCLKMIMGEL